METLIKIDTDLLLFFNSLNSPFWDNFFWVFTSIPVWVPFYISIFFVLCYHYGRSVILPLLAVVLVIVLCDQISSSVFKEFFERLRPSHEPSLEGIVKLVNGKKGGKFGFVSSHAANSIGLALISSLFIRKWYIIASMFLWAFVNSYSRIYMGLHYPGDIIGGWVLGILIAALTYYAYKKISFRILHQPKFTSKEFGKETLIIIGILGTTVFVIFYSSKLLLKLM